MNTRTALEALAQTAAQTANVISAAESVADALQALRDGTTDDQWDQLCENELIDALIAACMDLEAELED